MSVLRMTAEQFAARQKLTSPKARTQALGRLKTGAMNKTEARYAQHLEGLRIAGDVNWYRFEACKFRLADLTFYTPDFMLMRDTGEIELHEVKGARAIFQDDARVKIKVAAELFPIFRFVAVYPSGTGWKMEVFG